jgi:hypothetical protein
MNTSREAVVDASVYAKTPHDAQEKQEKLLRK